jgi:two-component system cell cycle response regulator CpdR
MSETARQKARVLFVDDDDAIRVMARRLLAGWGYDVTVQPGAVAALDALEASADAPEGSGQGPFDLLITDVAMPGINGVELATRALRRWPTLRILFISGQGGDTPERQTITRLGLPFLGKPFKNDDFELAVRLALSPLHT